MTKYGSVENSTPYAKDDYNSRFTYVRASRAKHSSRTRAEQSLNTG